MAGNSESMTSQDQKKPGRKKIVPGALHCIPRGGLDIGASIRL